MEGLTQKKPLLLIVEDDVHGLDFMEFGLIQAGFAVETAKSVPQAHRRIEKVGLQNFCAVITDYRLPGKSGIDLLEWIKAHDETLATVIVTGQGEKSIVKSSLAKGAFDYLDKPITYQMIANVAKRACEHTQKQRQFHSDRYGLKQLEKLDQAFNARIPQSLQGCVQLHYRPLHELGGDFFLTHDYGDGHCVFMVGDVAGHDVSSGYVSTYFQGLFQGFMESGSTVESALQLFNRALRKQYAEAVAKSSVPVSVAASVIEIIPQRKVLRHWNFGMHPVQIVNTLGFVQSGPFGNFPLGWMEQCDTKPALICLESNAFLYVLTDGLSDFADDLRVSLLSLFSKFIKKPNFYSDLPIVPSDDILAIRINLNPEVALTKKFEPILSEHYAGTEIDHIDHLQSVWRRRINFALDDVLGDRLYELLICLREGMINAFVHGCDRAPDKFAHLQISVDSEHEFIRVRIDDPGRGHSFDLQKRLEELQTQMGGDHLGLGIIQHLSDDFIVDNNGTTLCFDFKVKPE